MNELARILKKNTTDEQRKKIYPKIIELLESEDWDTQDESVGIDSVLDNFLPKNEE